MQSSNCEGASRATLSKNQEQGLCQLCENYQWGCPIGCCNPLGPRDTRMDDSGVSISVNKLPCCPGGYCRPRCKVLPEWLDIQKGWGCLKDVRRRSEGKDV